MKKNWLQERIKFLESYMGNNPNYPHKMQERDKNLINVLKKFSSLPEKQQNKLKYMLERTLKRHKEIERGLKIFDYYSKTHTISLNMTPK